MLHITIYGFADETEVEAAIKTRLAATNADKKEELAGLLGEAIAAILEINASIPHFSKHRHLIAGALELFADKQNGSED